MKEFRDVVVVVGLRDNSDDDDDVGDGKWNALFDGISIDDNIAARGSATPLSLLLLVSFSIMLFIVKRSSLVYIHLGQELLAITRSCDAWCFFACNAE